MNKIGYDQSRTERGKGGTPRPSPLKVSRKGNKEKKNGKGKKKEERREKEEQWRNIRKRREKERAMEMKIRENREKVRKFYKISDVINCYFSKKFQYKFEIFS